MGDNLPYVNLGTCVGGPCIALSVSAGDEHTCVIVSGQDGVQDLRCFGANYYGQLGIGSTVSSAGTTPATTGDGLPFVDVGDDRY